MLVRINVYYYEVSMLAHWVIHQYIYLNGLQSASVIIQYKCIGTAIYELFYFFLISSSHIAGAGHPHCHVALEK